MALKSIAEVHQKGKVPIVCGGTNYYIEALLFNNDEAIIKQEEVDSRQDAAQSFNK